MAGLLDCQPSVLTQMVIDAMLYQIETGCKSISADAELSPDVRGYFTRRYALSIENHLSQNNDWPNQIVLNLTYALGQTAGALWLFWSQMPAPVQNEHPQVDPRLIMKAAHLMEDECQSFMSRLLKDKPAADRERLTMIGQYCG